MKKEMKVFKGRYENYFFIYDMNLYIENFMVYKKEI